MTRDGCCESWRKPCEYHQGWEDALDVYGVPDGATAAKVRRALAITAAVDTAEADEEEVILAGVPVQYADQMLRELREITG